MLSNFHDCIVNRTDSVRSAIEVIQNSERRICLVVDDDAVLLGTVTDGDVRRGLLNGVDIQSRVDDIMYTEPTTAIKGTPQNELLATLNAELIQQIPIVDERGRVQNIVHIDELTEPEKCNENFVILMAGGLGSRLTPLTQQTPKPMLQVADKPVLEIIIENFIRQNFRNFFLSVNYKAETIISHFGDGAGWNANIRYLEENQRLGTAGALRLLSEETDHPIIVMNADVLTRIHFPGLVDYHNVQNARATMCVREHDFQVPYGVVDIDENGVNKIDEKPVHRFFINAGIYVLDSKLISIIPKNESFDMTNLLDQVIAAGFKTAAYPIHEYWIDIGQLDDLSRANSEYQEFVDT